MINLSCPGGKYIPRKYTRPLQTFPANRNQANYQVAENWQPNSKNFKHSNYKGLRDTQGVYPSFY